MSVKRAMTAVLRLSRRKVIAAAASTPIVIVAGASAARAASASEIDREAGEALRRLYADSEKARQLGEKAHAILIFPRITKAGLVVGGQEGEGTLRRGDESIGYFRLLAGSFGLQAGVQTFSLAVFFITESALSYLDDSDGWAIGADPNVVIADAGAAAQLNTTTLTQDVYAIPFGQQGLMAGISLEGSKINRINPDP